MALVPVDEAEMKKQRNERLKAQAKKVAGGKTSTKVGKVLFDIDEEATFVTGIGIPGKSKNKPKMTAEEERELLMSEEDKLLNSVNQTEKDMNSMMKYLDAVEGMMGGDDLAQIRRMLNYTTQSVDHHSKAYSNIKIEV